MTPETLRPASGPAVWSGPAMAQKSGWLHQLQPGQIDALEVAAMITEARNRLGAIDIMAHNVGIFPSSTIVKMKEAEWDQVIDTNLKSLFLV